MTPAKVPSGAHAGVEARQPYVSATVVHVQKPTSARPGDAAVVHADGRIEGFVGGVCAESTVRMHALQAISTGEPLLLRILPGEGDASPDDEGTVSVHNPCLSGGALQIFLQPHLPPKRITVVGSAPIARALAELSRQMGYEVNQPDDADAELPAETSAVVVASHGRSEEQVLMRALAAGVPYIGLVASSRRGKAILEGLPLSPEDLARVHTPAGLNIGAKAPHEVAVSILSEMISLQSAAPPSWVRSLDEPEPEVTTAVDPVCGMTVAAVEATLHLEADGGLVWFCSEGCLRTFEGDPARHRG